MYHEHTAQPPGEMRASRQIWAVMRAWPTAMLVGALLCGPTPSAGAQEDTSFAGIVAGIHRADRVAIDRAGTSGDPAYIPHLRAALNDPRLRFSGNAMIALAKLEDRETQQAVFCASIGEFESSPVSWFRFVGGWYAIQALDAILMGAGQAAFERAVDRHPTDVQYLPPRVIALDVLPRMVPNPPFAADSNIPWLDVADDAAAQWHQWIAEHRDELSQLRPRGEQIEFTEAACARKRWSVKLPGIF